MDRGVHLSTGSWMTLVSLLNILDILDVLVADKFISRAVQKLFEGYERAGTEFDLKRRAFKHRDGALSTLNTDDLF